MTLPAEYAKNYGTPLYSNLSLACLNVVNTKRVRVKVVSFLIGFTFIVGLIAAPVALAVSFTTTQLTSNSNPDDRPQVSGDNVVWRGGSGVSSEIYLADVAPGNTPGGLDVDVSPGANVTLKFEDVSLAGNTVVTTSTTPVDSPPSGFNFLGVQFDITTTAEFNGSVLVTLPYDEASVSGDENDLKLLHWNGSEWEDVTVSVDADNNTITGSVNSFSEHIVAESITPATGLNTVQLSILALLLIMFGSSMVLFRPRLDLSRRGSKLIH